MSCSDSAGVAYLLLQIPSYHLVPFKGATVVLEQTQSPNPFHKKAAHHAK